MMKYNSGLNKKDLAGRNLPVYLASGWLQVVVKRVWQEGRSYKFLILEFSASLDWNIVTQH